MPEECDPASPPAAENVQPAQVVPLGPVTAQERIQVIDILRGFALFGIIAANMRAFNSPEPAYFNWQLMWTGTADRIAQGLIDWLIQGKFVTLFAFLFGLGFAVQMTRAEERGRSVLSFYPRRLFVLLLFGAAHSFLLWWGDILLSYASMGFVLLLFRKRSQRTVLVWTVVLAVLPVVMMTAYYVVVRLGVHAPSQPEPKPEALTTAIGIYSHGSWGRIFVQRFRDWKALNAGWFFTPVFILPRYLFGLYLWRSGFVQNLAAHAPLLKRVCKWGLVVGLILNAASALAINIWNPNPNRPTMGAVFLVFCFTFGVPALSAAYASSVALLSKHLGFFAAVGRMALTNYLLQSVVCTWLYYSFGLGLFGKVGPALGLVPTFAVYIAQVLFSNWWLRRFEFGPMEWLWRSLTYGRFQPMRAATAIP